MKTLVNKSFAPIVVCLSTAAVGCSTQEPAAGQNDPPSIDASPAASTTAAGDGATDDPVDTAGLLGFSDAAFPYIYFDRDEVLLDGIDFDATLKIADAELTKGGSTSILTIWTIRDQNIPVQIATRITELYFRYIDGDGLRITQAAQGITFGHDFAVWHFAWAMGNIYRLGTSEVKSVIQSAYDDALNRPATLNPPYGQILSEHLTGKRIYMGDAHDAGRAYARSHIVIPGNPLYLQSFEEYAAR